jgi:hypothetical protein
MSLGRTFAEEHIPAGAGDSRVPAMKIVCAECSAVAFFAHQTGKTRKPPVAAKQNFQAKGWVVGSGPRKDFCPLHAAPSSRKGRADMPAKETATPEPGRKAEAPREITREERGIIFAKIGDVYGTDRYVTPWSDQKVADDLGVPRAWVSDVREQFYGPEGSNPLFDQYLTEAASVIRLQGEITEARKAVLDMFRKANDEAAKVRVRCDELDSKVRDVQALAKRVEREIGR